MANIHGIGYLDTSGIYHGFESIDGKPHITNTPCNYDLVFGNITGCTLWSKIGMGISAVTETDVWSYSATQAAVALPSAELQMEVVSSDNTQDIGTVIFSGTSTGGSTTSLIDTGKDFTAGTPVAVGDCIILSGGEHGFVTAVAATELTIASGFSRGGSGDTVAYQVVDKSAYTGAQAVLIEYLDDTLTTKYEIVVLNGTTAVATTGTDLYRINRFYVVAAGSGYKPVGNLFLRNTADTPVYSYITAGYTRSGNVSFTVPASKTLYVTTINISFGYAANQTHYCRIYTRANQIPNSTFLTGSIFYPYTELVCANSSHTIELDSPTKLVAGTDIKVSAIASVASGVISTALRGWLKDD